MSERPDKFDNTVAEGAGEAVSAELFSEMSLVGGWEDRARHATLSQAMQKLPPQHARQFAGQRPRARPGGIGGRACIYGTVERYKERVGRRLCGSESRGGDVYAASDRCQSKEVVWTAKFSKSQKALSENMLNLVNFLQNTGRWVRAHEIANEGVKAAVANLRSEIALNQNIKHFETGSYEQEKEMSHRYKGGPE